MNVLAVAVRQLRTSARLMMKVIPVPALEDNYMYLLVDESSKLAAIVDPADVSAVKSAVAAQDVKLVAALVTHHHWDHAGGTKQLSDAYGGSIHIYGSDDRIESLTNKVKGGDNFKIGNLDIACLFTPCHTSGHTCYYVTEGQQEKVVFTGDTLFIGGCGRFFEGTAAQMDAALNDTLGGLPGETKVYCGHEYTVANLQFAQSVEPDNEDVKKKLAWAKARCNAKEYTVPSTIAEEKTFNPFMRVRDCEALHKLSKSTDPIKTMAHIRDLKNTFKS